LKAQKAEFEKILKINNIRRTVASSFSTFRSYNELENLYINADFPPNCSEDLLENYFSQRTQSTPEYIGTPSSKSNMSGNNCINISNFRRHMITGTKSDFSVKLADINDSDITTLILDSFPEHLNKMKFNRLLCKLVKMLNKFRGMVEFISINAGCLLIETSQFQPAFTLFLEEVCKLFTNSLKIPEKFIFAANKFELNCSIEVKNNKKNVKNTLKGYTDIMIENNLNESFSVGSAILGELKCPIGFLYKSGIASCRDQQ